jgi:hypothetical protein
MYSWQPILMQCTMYLIHAAAVKQATTRCISATDRLACAASGIRQCAKRKKVDKLQDVEEKQGHDISSKELKMH